VPTQPETLAIPSDGEQDLTADADQADKDKGPDKDAAPGDREPPRTDETKPQDDLTLPDPTEADLKKLRPETRRRIEQLLSQRNAARQEFEQIRPELDQHRQLQGYLQQHQLAPDDVNMLLGVGASLRRGDYQAFLNGVTPYVMAAQEALGLRVAPDLNKQVEDGLITEDTARELTRTRHRAAQAEHRLREQNQVTLTDNQQRNLTAIRSAVDTWEATIRSRDPDYAHKAVAVRRFSQALLQERGTPATPQQAVELAQSAYDEASRELAKLRPPPAPTRPAPSGNHIATGGPSQTQPRSYKEAALMALANMRRAS
jgi:hypothetical protein